IELVYGAQSVRKVWAVGLLAPAVTRRAQTRCRLVDVAHIGQFRSVVADIAHFERQGIGEGVLDVQVPVKNTGRDQIWIDAENGARKRAAAIQRTRKQRP